LTSKKNVNMDYVGIENLCDDCLKIILTFLEPIYWVQFTLVCKNWVKLCVDTFWVKQIVKYHGFGFEDYKKFHGIELKKNVDPPIQIKKKFLEMSKKKKEFFFVYVHPFLPVELAGLLSKDRLGLILSTSVRWRNITETKESWRIVIKNTEKTEIKCNICDELPLILAVSSFLCNKTPGFCIEQKIMNIKNYYATKIL